MINLSIVVPLFNEEESLPELCAWIKRVCDKEQLSYEVLLLDDGSTDASWKVIQEIGAKQPEIKGIRLQRNYGKSGALSVGFSEAQGEVVITMDADLQDSPDEIPELRQMILRDGYDVVSGWKKKRYDPITKTLPTKLFNWATRKMSDIELHDFNCGLKSYHRDVVKNIEVYGEMHRYIPVLAKWGGFPKIGEKVVEHRARKYGTTKFGLDRFVNGFLDLMSLYFMSKFGKRPMHFFGLWGSIMLLIGFSFTLYLGLDKLFFDINARLITQRPEFYIALTLMLLGSQFFIAGFLGELVMRNARQTKRYHVKETV